MSQDNLKEIIREAARVGDASRLKSILLHERANPCDIDEFGLTPLMYAVWNGHTECVRYLISNHMGVDCKGVKCTSINLVSCKGYSAYHLACMDCPKWSQSDIITLLLICGIDTSIKDVDGKIGDDYVQNNEEIVETIKKFNNAEHDPPYMRTLQNIWEKLQDQYTFKANEDISWEVDQSLQNTTKNKFPLPKYLFHKERVGYLPSGLKIHEHHIEPLAKSGFDLRGQQAIHCIEFSREQAIVNQDRREKLLLKADNSWKPLSVEDVEEIEKRKRAVKNKCKKREPIPDQDD